VPSPADTFFARVSGTNPVLVNKSELPYLRLRIPSEEYIEHLASVGSPLY